MDFDKKTLFSELDKDIKKHAKKNDKKHKEKMGKIKSNDPFGYGFDPDDFNKKKKKAGQTANCLTKSEKICKVIDNTIYSLNLEINEIEHRQQEEQKRLERWEIAQAQGCTYQQFLDIEEVSRQSEEYEMLMGM